MDMFPKTSAESRNKNGLDMRDMFEWKRECEAENVVDLPCEHRFHISCIQKWLQKGSACCPLCNWDTRCIFRKAASSAIPRSGIGSGNERKLRQIPLIPAAGSVTQQVRTRRMRRLPRCPTMLNIRRVQYLNK